MFSQRINGRFLAVAAAVAMTLGVPFSTDAAVQTANLPVTATVAPACSISTSAVAFGVYDPATVHAATPLDSTGTVTVTCVSGASAAITLGQGANPDAGSTDAIPIRRMANGTNFLSYDLYSDTPGSTVWGNTAATGVGHTGTGTATILSVYGRVFPGQTLAPQGSYTDTVLATVTF